MKKDLTKYYAEVTEKDAKKVLNLYEKFGRKRDLEWVFWAISKGAKYYSLTNSGYGLSVKYHVEGKKKISLKTLTNYIAHNNQVDRSFVEPKELRKLTEENTTLANGNKELLQKCVFLENEVKILQGTERKKDEVISIQNDMLEVKELENETLKKELNAKSVALILVSFTLTIALIFIAQKL